MSSLTSLSVVTAFNSVKNALQRIGVKAPWQLTGSWTMPDYLHFMPSGNEYRKTSPGSQPVKAIVPSDHPRLIYDTKYFVRDYRRNSTITKRTVAVKEPFDFATMYAKSPIKPEDVKEGVWPPTMPTRDF